MPGVTDEHNRTLPSPVFPTPIYETLLGGLLFFLLWIFRRKMNRPLMMFGVYLFVNGAERYLVEMIRVNKSYGSAQLTQAEMIALGLMLSGFVLALFSYRTQKPVSETAS